MSPRRRRFDYLATVAWITGYFLVGEAMLDCVERPSEGTR